MSEKGLAKFFRRCLLNDICERLNCHYLPLNPFKSFIAASNFFSSPLGTRNWSTIELIADCQLLSTVKFQLFHEIMTRQKIFSWTLSVTLDVHREQSKISFFIRFSLYFFFFLILLFLSSKHLQSSLNLLKEFLPPCFFCTIAYILKWVL